MSLLFTEAAKRLGSDKEIMDSYWAYHEGEQNWFFSPNPNLEGATGKPSFPGAGTWRKSTSAERRRKWNGLGLRQRMTISTLAGFGHEGRGINLDSMIHFSKLREACISGWRDDLYSIFWSGSSDGKRWLCNVFVGDAIYLYSGRNFTSGNNHYYDPLQIYMGQSFLRKRSSYKDVEAGDIVVMKYGGLPKHVEIITRIQNNWLADDGFCSIGAGRGDRPARKEGDGKEKCDPFVDTSFGRRELENSENIYFYL